MAATVVSFTPTRVPTVAARANASPVARAAVPASGFAPSARMPLRQLSAREPSALRAGFFDRQETEAQTSERRDMESLQVEDKIDYISNLAEFNDRSAKAGNNLVVLEIMSDTVCDLDQDQRRASGTKEEVMAPCVQMKSALQRTARNCDDATFLACIGDADAESRDLCKSLGVYCFPTLQFYKGGKLLWEQRGAGGGSENLGIGLTYYGAHVGNSSAASGVDLVADLTCVGDIQRMAAAVSNELVVVDVSKSDSKTCMTIFPAVSAMAKTMTGYASFGRVMVDTSGAGGDEVVAEYGITSLPTFLFFFNGRKVAQEVCLSRGAMIATILGVGQECGLQPPPPPGATSEPVVMQNTAGGRNWTV